MRGIRYPATIQSLKINAREESNLRYSLKVDYANVVSGSQVCVIMMNPSKANKITSDLTVNKVFNYFQRDPAHHCKSISMLNLFPYYEPDSSNLNTHVNESYRSTMDENMKVMKQFIRDSDKIVLAWGDVPKKFDASLHNDVVREVITCIEEENVAHKLFVFRTHHANLLTHKSPPRHPNRVQLAGLEKVQSYSFSRGLLRLNF